ncbi:beta-ketoacyl synthase [Endozoicomonas sp. GU-1]|uniref:beta-ketoacyl synthase n=1 Tax=Endozoicomonas sp. GU-1 TaxID=3009078 RepID=UPI0022B4102A|nr:beta-ketoacyl synthase [Endozoicomonas sp. GU-1]WBA83940.1 beta-ketoacyl synthase [Endozoicomonas sp. GU-1]WBA86921.1 beta-ketoacyl synthase [Endozoicomonas sp. GU-1]
MSRLPVIVAQGGVSPAGRTSGFHGYRRLVLECLSDRSQHETLAALRMLRNLPQDSSREDILSGTLIRQLENNLFNPQAIPFHQAIQAESGSEIILKGRRLPNPLPDGWQLEKLEDGQIKVRIEVGQPLMIPSIRESLVNAAGQLPSGFAPEKLYQSRNHPRSLTMTVFGASDAIYSSGMDWHAVKQKLSPEQVAVYSGSAMSQLDFNGNGGLLQSRLLGKRVTSKQCPLGFAEMSADFINAYILGSLGGTGTSMGACATMLYNLEQAAADIRSGRRRLVIVGNSEAPITPEVMEGYSTMGALTTDAALRKLDGLSDSDHPDWRRACRPFADNAGFTIAESSQFLVLMDDELALECGAQILGSVADVFINADGFKKSISAPGAGNHLTVARAAALGRAIAGEDALRYRSFVQAHGTGTPQNRVTESQILSETAKVFGMESWPVAAVKSYLGHSIGAAGGDQIMATLGVWKHGFIPGIRTINGLAEDVYSEKLNILLNHLETGVDQMDLALINAKGFGGNNATALLLSPEITRKMLKARHGDKAMTQWQQKNETVTQQQDDYEQRCQSGAANPIYQFGEGVLDGSDLTFSEKQVNVPGYGKALDLEMENPFWPFNR